jgi:CubicO group peptidase (beta-lactamase class C family)
MEELTLNLQKFIDNKSYQGIEWKINYKGKIFQNKVGYSNLSKKPLNTNSIYRIWSMTKPIISVATLQLIDEKKIKLDDPINLYLPQFNNLKVLIDENSSIENIKDVETMPTIKNLLLHTAGFSYGFLNDTVGQSYEKKKLFHSDNTTLEEEINILSSCPLVCEPSKKWIYSVSIDVLGRILEVVLKDSLQNILKKKIFDPLEMIDTGYSVPLESDKRLVNSYTYNSEKNFLTEVGKQGIEIFGYPLNVSSYARGGHGLYSSLEDYHNFARMLLNGKSTNGETILSDKMLKFATIDHLGKEYFPLEIVVPGKDNDENFMDPYGWGLGFRVFVDLEKGNNIGSLGEFGWSGAASTFFLVDPINNLTAVLMTQVLNGLKDLNKNFLKVIYSNLDL